MYEYIQQLQHQRQALKERADTNGFVGFCRDEFGGNGCFVGNNLALMKYGFQAIPQRDYSSYYSRYGWNLMDYPYLNYPYYQITNYQATNKKPKIRRKIKIAQIFKNLSQRF